jgi:beta-lactam-binding protein with PASTA domain
VTEVAIEAVGGTLAAIATGWLGQVPALVGLVVGAVLAAVFEPKIVALLQRLVGNRLVVAVPVSSTQPDGGRRSRRWLIALAAAIGSVLAVVTVVDYARGTSLVGDRDRTFLPAKPEPAEVVPVAVPDVVNWSFDKAEARLESFGFEVDREEEFSDTVYSEHVIRTEPEANARIRKGRHVVVVISGKDATVPDVAGSTYDEAKAELEKEGLVVEPPYELPAATEVGTVIRTDPEANKRVEEGSSVRVYVAVAGVRVPDVTGFRLSDAQNAVADAGLVSGAGTSERDPEVPVGRVIRTDPSANTVVEEKRVVTFVVSSGAGPPPVPSPTPNAPP